MLEVTYFKIYHCQGIKLNRIVCNTTRNKNKDDLIFNIIYKERLLNISITICIYHVKFDMILNKEKASNHREIDRHSIEMIKHRRKTFFTHKNS